MFSRIHHDLPLPRHLHGTPGFAQFLLRVPTSQPGSPPRLREFLGASGASSASSGARPPRWSQRWAGPGEGLAADPLRGRESSPGSRWSGRWAHSCKVCISARLSGVTRQLAGPTISHGLWCRNSAVRACSGSSTVRGVEWESRVAPALPQK